MTLKIDDVPKKPHNYFPHEALYVSTKMIMDVCGITHYETFNRAVAKIGLRVEIGMMNSTKKRYNIPEANRFIAEYKNIMAEGGAFKTSLSQVELKIAAESKYNQKTRVMLKESTKDIRETLGKANLEHHKNFQQLKTQQSKVTAKLTEQVQRLTEILLLAGIVKPEDLP